MDTRLTFLTGPEKKPPRVVSRNIRGEEGRREAWRRGGGKGFLGARVQGGQDGFHTLGHSKSEFQVRVNKQEQQEVPCGEG